ncbi:uncharacterized protein [Zea mays]|uniref:uncharacterized protein isoform X1 n=1 Tax=Zea mays TaxID=4577 RepID=UPI0009A9804B|nr:uncharacterized protein LOC100272342 isoform X1 [Zea mays]|eukprot:XP_020402927.1 putative HLH DNA-binding domain superfamily protein isoform X1 [Zea mays]
MWNCSSLLLQYGDDYAARCESSSSPAGAVGLDRILAAEYGRFDSLDLSPPPPLHGLQAQTLFAIHGSSENCLGIGANPIYSTEARPAFSQLSFTQPAADTAAHYSMKWTAAGETATGGGGSRLRGSKRLKTKTPATAQGPQHHGQRCSPKPTTSQSIKAPPCKRSQKLGDKITALQQLVSPYGKVSSWTCRSCPVPLLVTWHVACADGYGISAPRGSHLHQAPPRADPGEQMAHRPLTYSEWSCDGRSGTRSNRFAASHVLQRHSRTRATKRAARRVCAGEACAWRRCPRPSCSSCRPRPRSATATRKTTGAGSALCKSVAGAENDAVLPCFSS